MNPYQEAVIRFHHALDVTAPERPTLENYRARLRIDLILEVER